MNFRIQVGKGFKQKSNAFTAHFLHKNADAKATVKLNGNAALMSKYNATLQQKKPSYPRVIWRNMPNQSATKSIDDLSN